MNCEDLNKYLEDFIDSSLPKNLQDDFEDSLDKCPEVEQQINLYKKLFRSINQMPLGFDPPTGIVFRFTADFRKTAEEEYNRSEAVNKKDQKKRSLEEKIKKLSSKKKVKKDVKLKKLNIFKHKFGFGFAVPVIIIFCLYYFFFLNSSKTWDIAIEKGSYEINNLASFDLELNPDDILSTGVNSNITIYIGSEATVNLKSNSSIKVLQAGRADNHMEFINGSIIYSSTADNHDFLISYKSLKVTDHRSTYEMALLDDGSISLNVKKGKISVGLLNDMILLSHDYKCEILNAQTITLPVHVDASQRFIKNVEDLNFNPRNYEALAAALREAKREDALTLLRILEIMPTRYRGMVFERLNVLFPLPSWVTKLDVLSLDRTALDKWWENIEWQL